MIEQDHAIAEQILSGALTGGQKNQIARYKQIAVDLAQKSVKYGFTDRVDNYTQIYHEAVNGVASRAGKGTGMHSRCSAGI